MQYNLDLSKISIDDYKELLRNQNLLPGRRVLWENLDESFLKIHELDVENIEQLRKILSTPQKLADFATRSGIPADYLVILKRELGSLEQKPLMLSDFPGISPEKIAELAALSIKTSRDYLERYFNHEDEISCLCDLVRINGIGPVAARAFYEAGYHSVRAIAEAQAADMLAKVTAVNIEKGYYKASLGVKDMQFCIDFAGLLIQYMA
ncbi:hypothetical protein SDC9_93613 [bioreactor metagenome]|uniref:DUF4332 domain-containing protein n=1 Tax=bioreactor metagenome TaxID=1076179 RepID=A0A645A1X0_9ZZZZ